MAEQHWSTVGDGKPPDIPQKVWNNMPEDLKAKIRAQGQARAKQQDEVSDLIQQRSQNTTNYFDGSPEENAAWQRASDPAYQRAQAAFGSPAWGGLAPPSAFDYGPPVDMQKPGALAANERANQQALEEYDQFADQFIADNRRSIANLASQNAQFNAQDAATVSELRSTLSGIGLLPWEAIPDSLAAQAYADPASIAAQNQALDMLFGAANGSMDAHSNPQDVANQQKALNMLFGAAGGSLDAHTNPEDLARQKQAADKLWSLSTPEVTAEEKFIYEKQRLIEEQDRRAAMDAALRNLSARGQLGSGHEIGAMLGAQQQTSQNRVLGDLGAQANAVARSMEALGMHSQLSTAMRGQSDAMTSGNMNRRLGGMQGAATQSSNMRNASDAMAQGNMNRRLNATAGAGNLASNMRESSFNEEYSRGRAQDIINQANQVSRQQYGIADANLGLNKAGMISNASFGATGAAAGRASNVAGLEIGTNGSAFNARTGGVDRQISAADKAFINGWLATQAKNAALGDEIAWGEGRRAENMYGT